jgi:uncharacterized protein YjbJ (UPF0337 family)
VKGDFIGRSGRARGASGPGFGAARAGRASETETSGPRRGGTMGDRLQRAEGKAKEAKGRAKRKAGLATARPGTEARGAGKEVAGKAKNATGKARSALKKGTR